MKRLLFVLLLASGSTAAYADSAEMEQMKAEVYRLQQDYDQLQAQQRETDNQIFLQDLDQRDQEMQQSYRSTMPDLEVKD